MASSDWRWSGNRGPELPWTSQPIENMLIGNRTRSIGVFFTKWDSRVARKRIDMVRLWNAWSETESLRQHSFLGPMNWETRNARHYLYRRRVGIAKSLGPRSPETEGIFVAFTEGKRANAERLKVLNGRSASRPAFSEYWVRGGFRSWLRDPARVATRQYPDRRHECAPCL